MDHLLTGAVAPGPCSTTSTTSAISPGLSIAGTDPCLGPPGHQQLLLQLNLQNQQFPQHRPQPLQLPQLQLHQQPQQQPLYRLVVTMPLVTPMVLAFATSPTFHILNAPTAMRGSVFQVAVLMTNVLMVTTARSTCAEETVARCLSVQSAFRQQWVVPIAP